MDVRHCQIDLRPTGRTGRVILRLLVLASCSSMLGACANALTDSERRSLCEVPSEDEPTARSPVIAASETRNWGNLMARIRGEALRRNEGCVEAPMPDQP